MPVLSVSAHSLELGCEVLGLFWEDKGAGWGALGVGLVAGAGAGVGAEPKAPKPSSPAKRNAFDMSKLDPDCIYGECLERALLAEAGGEPKPVIASCDVASVIK
jgi:hypothetical protein